jgi:hypothetical protein
MYYARSNLFCLGEDLERTQIPGSKVQQVGCRHQESVEHREPKKVPALNQTDWPWW